ncbi:hypothetical protein BDB00DRAFT_829003 [Zychaea mexicana]|uniref:uncharacterized protein n=1 Tax=Zychaea mexicana TaxID=64656 RepID=UPI0022FDBCB7|nr:uncharacterized protein BDB00DRAFT_829003 [Zychaea mexicana]KAI9492241.1 hypothetical protein BDB00DRAFT_829003 [Zychaea mexicana]
MPIQSLGGTKSSEHIVVRTHPLSSTHTIAYTLNIATSSNSTYILYTAALPTSSRFSTMHTLSSQCSYTSLLFRSSSLNYYFLLRLVPTSFTL